MGDLLFRAKIALSLALAPCLATGSWTQFIPDGKVREMTKRIA